MGTRHIIAVKIDGEYKVAQYGQWDGYPSGQGAHVLAFLKELTPETTEVFKQKCRKLSWMDEKELEAMWKAAGADDSGMISCDKADAFSKAHPEFSRDTCASILSLIAERDNLRLQNSIDFVGDSLFCEWAYVVDFDANTFEVFQGFQKSPLNKSDRFHAYKQKFKRGEDKYYPVRLQALWYLDNLPEVKGFEDLVEQGHISEPEAPEVRKARLEKEAISRKAAQEAEAALVAAEEAKKKVEDESFQKVVEETAGIPVRKLD